MADCELRRICDGETFSGIGGRLIGLVTIGVLFCLTYWVDCADKFFTL